MTAAKATGCRRPRSSPLPLPGKPLSLRAGTWRRKYRRGCPANSIRRRGSKKRDSDDLHGQKGEGESPPYYKEERRLCKREGSETRSSRPEKKRKTKKGWVESYARARADPKYQQKPGPPGKKTGDHPGWCSKKKLKPATVGTPRQRAQTKRRRRKPSKGTTQPRDQPGKEKKNCKNEHLDTGAFPGTQKTNRTETQGDSRNQPALK